MVTTTSVPLMAFRPPQPRTLPLAGPLVWECVHDPSDGQWYIVALRGAGADRGVGVIVFVLNLSQWHQSEAKAREICEALGRIYS